MCWLAQHLYFPCLLLFFTTLALYYTRLPADSADDTGEAYYLNNQHNEAINDYTKAENLGMTDACVCNARALAWTKLDRFDLARVDLSNAIALNAEDPETLFQRSNCFYVMKEFESGVKDLTTALELKPNDPKLLYNRGLQYYALDQYKKALKDFENAINNRLPPKDSPDCWYHNGLCHANRGNHKEGVPAFAQAIKLAGNRTHYIHERAKSHQMTGMYEEAVQDFSVVITRQPANAHAYFRRAFAHKALEHYDDAAADFEAAKELEPHNPALIVNYKRIHDTECIELCKAGEEQQ